MRLFVWPLAVRALSSLSPATQAAWRRPEEPVDDPQRFL